MEYRQSYNSDWMSDWQSNKIDLADSQNVDQRWSELSLTSEEDPDLRGSLQFRHRHKSSESADSTTTAVEPDQAITHQSSTTPASDNDSQRPSLAYQLGMMVVSSAAEVVNKVADGGKKNRDAIKQLRSELENMNEKYEALVQESENLKQWLAYYENVKFDLETQINESNGRFNQQHGSMQQKLDISEKELNKCRRKAEDAEATNCKMKSELDAAKQALDSLTQEIQVLQTSHHESLLKDTAVQTDGKTNLSQSTQTTGLHIPSVVSSSAEFRHKERQLHDATCALKVAHARADKLRLQLMTTMESMKSQSFQMKASRLALEDALNEARQLKKLLSEESMQKSVVEQELNAEKEKHTVTTNKLVEVQERVADLSFKADQLTDEVCLKNAEGQTIRRDYIRLKEEMALEKLAESLTSNALYAAFSDHLFSLYSEKIKPLQTECEEHLKCIRETESSRKLLQGEFQALMNLTEQERGENATWARAANARISELSNHLNRGKEVEKQLKVALINSNSTNQHLRVKLERALADRAAEINRLNSQINQLQNEKSVLKNHVAQATKNVGSASSCQTDLLCSDIEALKSDISNAQDEINGFRQRSAEQDEENSRLREELEKMQTRCTQMTNSEQEMAKMRDMNRKLNFVIESDRKAANEKDHILSRLEDDYRRLDWVCREQQSHVYNLRRQNYALRRATYNENNTAPTDARLPSEEKASTATSKVHDKSNASENVRPRYSHSNNLHDYVRSHLQHTDDAKALGTIPEADEKSTFSQEKLTLQSGDSLPASGSKYGETSLSACSKFEKASSASCSKAKPEEMSSGPSGIGVAYASTSVNKVVSTPKARKMKNKHFAVRSNVRSAHASASSAATSSTISAADSLPIWRRENIQNSAYVQTCQTENLLNQQSEGSIVDEVFVETSQEEHIPSQTRRLGIPMSEQNFRRLIGEGDLESSHDDGYSSSTNSIVNDSRRNRSRHSSGSQSVSSKADSSNSSREDSHYYVTFAGTTFDLASFSMTRMRTVTSSCEVTSTPEGMRQFLDFLANKTEEMDQDPNWRGKHNLGKPKDWLDLKGCYC
ncbi:unnamed protein product [Clavelina lepadiformis]|uniref:Uncharacterized protein n=1 Tax=Clavelina lepadiformis TaxID=159417 RepID=A0ABP0FAU7_CLALP